MVNKDRIVDSFLQYVQIDSPSRSEGKFAESIASELERLGFDVYINKAGEEAGSDSGNVIAALKGTRDGEPILFSCHMDTVSPGTGIKPLIKDDVIYSDGTTILGSDDKAGIAAVIEAIRVLKENNIPHGPIEVAFSVFEEGGLRGAKYMDFSRIKARTAFVLDSGGEPGEIVTKGPAQDKIYIKIIGRPAHAGVEPAQGISAIMVASRAINNMKLLRVDGETTANIGTISGGVATNIVPAEVTLDAEARSLDNDKLDKQTGHMVRCFEEAAEFYGAKTEIVTERIYGAFNIDEQDPIVTAIKNACAGLGLTAYTTSTGGGSDTNIFNKNGIKSINLGVGIKKAHTLEEHIYIKDLVNTAKMLVEIIKIY